jgi:hypothetical protein
MINSRIKATLESVIQEDPLEYSKGSPRLSQRSMPRRPTRLRSIMPSSTKTQNKKATLDTKRTSKAEKPAIGKKYMTIKKKGASTLKKAKAARKVKTQKKPKAGSPKKPPAVKTRKNVTVLMMIWTK